METADKRTYVRQQIFQSTKTENLNFVQYYITYCPETLQPHPSEPITCEWIMLQLNSNGSVREELTDIEEKLYLPIVDKITFGEKPSVLMHLNPSPENPLKIFYTATSDMWMTGIKTPSGKMCILKKLHGIMKYSVGIPFIEQIEIIGNNAANGEPIRESVVVNTSCF